MRGYLGEIEVKIEKSEFSKYTKVDWVLLWTTMHGQVDGSHHKAWLIDQIQRILFDTNVIIKKAEWDNGEYEFRYSLGSPSEAYLKFIKLYENNGEYEWSCGIAP